jgi:predicted acylesterase/phospholipase RssA
MMVEHPRNGRRHHADSAKTSRAPRTKVADLVLSGGGVKGIGLVGAVVALMEAGYRIGRISGTSAGSLVGAVMAAAAHGEQLTGEQLKEIALSLPYRKFLDPVSAATVPVLGTAWAALHGRGIYRGDFIHDWVERELRTLGVRTFGDLAIDDPDLPVEQRYRLVVTVADVTGDTWCGCRGITDASTASILMNSPWPMPCGRPWRSHSSSAPSPSPVRPGRSPR